MSNLEYIIQKYAIKNYGDLIIPDKSIYDEDTKTWQTHLHSTYPRIIQDEKSKEAIIRFLDLRDLGIIRVDDKFRIIDATSNAKCERQLVSRLDLWKQQAEKIVVTASSEVFAKISESIHVLNPLWQVLDQIVNSNSDKIKILEDDIDEQRRPGKIRQYLELLTELEIVKKVEDGYTYGNIYVGLLETANNDHQKLKTTLLSHVIKYKYSTIRQVFGITQLEPFVHLANSYYWDSLDAEKLIHTTRSHLYQIYQDYYGKIRTWDFESKLSDLIDQGSIHTKNEYLVGDEDQFSNMLEIKHATTPLNP